MIFWGEGLERDIEGVTPRRQGVLFVGVASKLKEPPQRIRDNLVLGGEELSRKMRIVHRATTGYAYLRVASRSHGPRHKVSVSQSMHRVCQRPGRGLSDRSAG